MSLPSCHPGQPGASLQPVSGAWAWPAQLQTREGQGARLLPAWGWPECHMSQGGVASWMRTSSHGVIGAGGQSSFQPPWGLSLPPQPPSIYSAVRCRHTPLISPLLFSALFMHCPSDAAHFVPTRWDRDAAVWFHAGSFWHQAAQRGTAGPALRAGMRAGHAPSLCL